MTGLRAGSSSWKLLYFPSGSTTADGRGSLPISMGFSGQQVLVHSLIYVKSLTFLQLPTVINVAFKYLKYKYYKSILRS